MFSFGTGELLLILVITLVIVGPEKLPLLARKIAFFIHQLRSVKDDITQKVSISSQEKTSSSQILKKESSITNNKEKSN